jgi:hypothetical protein
MCFNFIAQSRDVICVSRQSLTVPIDSWLGIHAGMGTWGTFILASHLSFDISDGVVTAPPPLLKRLCFKFHLFL